MAGAGVAAVAAGVLLSGCVAADSRPNILYLMADDLNADWKNDRLQWMPTLNKHFSDGGTFFKNHVAAVPVCGPSRSSMLLGRYPHNTGYLMNDDLDSVAAYLAKHNNTVGRWLRDSGYYTSFLGKYVNSCEGHVPSGWSHWGGFVQTYDFYNASGWDVYDTDPGSQKQRVMTGVHQADFLGNWTMEQVDHAKAAGKPFFISVTPVMPHWGTCDGPSPPGGYAPTDPHWEFQPHFDPATGRTFVMPISPCPTKRHAHAFDGQANPHISAVWNVTIKGPRPQWMQAAFESPPGTMAAYEADREDIGWRNRSAALLDLDDLISDLLTGLESRGVLDNTIWFFTSDNGYHLGEHKMPFGKGEPYMTDIALPMYVAGPGVPGGRVLPLPTTHIDITATIVDLAGARSFAPAVLDGKSFKAELLVSPSAASPLSAWRQHSFSEFFANNNTWQVARVVNETHDISLHVWCTNDTEVFDNKNDLWQTVNQHGSTPLASAVVAEYAAVLTTFGNCSGDACSEPAPAPRAVARVCQPIMTSKGAYAGSFSFVYGNGPKHAATGVRGWAVDFHLGGPGTGKPRGFPPIYVRMLVDGSWKGKLLPQTLANVDRPDIVGKNNVPNAQHGFVLDLTPLRDLKGKHTFQLHGVDSAQGNPFAVGGQKCLCNGVECSC